MNATKAVMLQTHAQKQLCGYCVFSITKKKRNSGGVDQSVRTRNNSPTIASSKPTPALLCCCVLGKKRLTLIFQLLAAVQLSG